VPFQRDRHFASISLRDGDDELGIDVEVWSVDEQRVGIVRIRLSEMHGDKERMLPEARNLVAFRNKSVCSMMSFVRSTGRKFRHAEFPTVDADFHLGLFL
jgi:hypothetical protein